MKPRDHLFQISSRLGPCSPASTVRPNTLEDRLVRPRRASVGKRSTEASGVTGGASGLSLPGGQEAMGGTSTVSARTTAEAV